MWNHINQSAKHKSLTYEEKKLYNNLSRSVGEVCVENATNVEAAETQMEEATPTTTPSPAAMPITSTGRQRYGDTRTMPYFDLTTPVLVEYMR